jgi:lysophospholipase
MIDSVLPQAPIYDAPPAACAFWLRAADGVRLRMAVLGQGPRGTIVLFPGRTEVIEKYLAVAPALMAGGVGLVAIDWRGQGLSDRATPDPLMGHVGDFAEYQADVAAYLAGLRDLDLPEPWYLLAHSMGGCIALCALSNGFAPRAAAFSGPMWGLTMTPAARALGWTLSAAARAFGQGKRYVPGLGDQATLDRMDFDTNPLTTDRATFDRMQAQVRAHPALSLGAPSLGWLNAALREMHALSRLLSPTVPTFAAIGALDQIISPGAFAARMARWPGGRMVRYPGAAHELMMERPAIRDDFVAQVRAHFGA